MACSQINLVSSMWTTLREVGLFFRFSPKRTVKLTAVIEGSNSSTRSKNLVDLCRTRLVARHSALIYSLQEVVHINCFNAGGKFLRLSPTKKRNADTSSKAGYYCEAEPI